MKSLWIGHSLQRVSVHTLIGVSGHGLISSLVHLDGFHPACSGFQAFGSRVRHTTLGDQASDKTGGHHVEGCVRGGAAPRCHLDCGDGAVLAQAGDVGDFPFVSFLLKKIGARFARVNKSIPERDTRS